MVAMRFTPLLLLTPLILAEDDGEGPRLGCGFGSGVGIADEDGDGFGSTIDCDDADLAINPYAMEHCDGIDNDCDDKVDEDDAVDALTWYQDYDYDGWGNAEGETTRACSQPEGYAQAGDCYDLDPRISPDALEYCDGVDNDCDGIADEDSVDVQYGCLDVDDDGYGDPEVCVTECRLPAGYVLNDGDCDDADPLIHPGAEDVCDGVDNDCDEVVDPLDVDRDGDGWTGCDGDCDDEDEAVSPDAEEVCGNEVDDDCDGHAGVCGIEGDYAPGDSGVLLWGTEAWDEAGSSLAIVGDLDGDGLDDLAVAAPCSNSDSGAGGSVHLLLGGWDWLEQAENSLGEAALTLRCPAGGGLAGRAVAGAGDVDADGLADLVIGAAGDSSSGVFSGAAWLVYGGSMVGLEGEQGLDELGWHLRGEEPGDRAGYALDGAGDVDGDGYDDLIVGAYAQGGVGQAYLVRGPVSASADLGSADSAWQGGADGDRAGIAVAGAGDVNGDGLGDLLVGASRVDGSGSSVGEAYLILGVDSMVGQAPLSDVACAVVRGDENGMGLGSALDGAGDLDGDGYGDVLVGAPEHRGAEFFRGLVLVLRGGSDGSLAPSATLLGGRDFGHFGAAVSSAGDVDADGLDDVLVGAPYHELDDGSAGLAALYLGSISGNVELHEAHASFLATSTDELLGLGLAGGGDVDGDGFGDLLIGAPGLERSQPEQGAAWLMLGGEGL